MGEKDLSEKILADYNDVFADIVNVLLFNGECKIKESQLENTSVHSMYRGADQKLHEQERDVAKIWKANRIRIALIGLEHQTEPEKRMPLRIFGYEGASYRSQLYSKSVYPVVTLVLYFGAKRWDYKKTLFEVVDVPDELKPFANDCRINVFEISWLDDETISKFKSDFRIVARFFSEKRKNKNYIPDDKDEIRHVDEVLKLLSAMTGDDQYEMVYASSKKGEIRTMCDVAERLVNKGRAEGRAEGEERLSRLFLILSDRGRIDDLKKAASDPSIRVALYKEFNL